MNLPDVVVVQSESFFDIRKTGLSIAPYLLDHFDALRQSGVCSGDFDVPAWGANTMRTEHAFLSGLENSALRYASFYPYAFIRRTVPSLPHAFGAMNYRCTAVHPYPSDFFLRHKVFPRLGFDAFVDEAAFADAARNGPYVSDQAVTDWLVNSLDQPADEPQFLFAITMENHGPLHLEKATALEASRLYLRPNGQIIDDLTVYLRHLANANQMLGRLQAFLAQRQRHTLLCFYGDHVPGMGHVYEALESNPRHSDYLIWANYETVGVRELAFEAQCLTPEQLGLKLARVAGVV
jgi:phosphoglycerol transferase MdoB-like AlkP superfamily enzyme